MWPKTYVELISKTSYCEKYAKLIVSQENKSKHIAKNAHEYAVRQFKIDGDVIAKGEGETRADYLLLNEDKKDAYLIELKGRHLEEAFNQLEKTDVHLKNVLKDFSIFWRVVYQSGTLNMQSLAIRKYRNKHPNLKIKARIMQEMI